MISLGLQFKGHVSLKIFGKVIKQSILNKI